MIDTIIKSVKRVRARISVTKYPHGPFRAGYEAACDDILILIERIQKMSAHKGDRNAVTATN